MHKGFTKIHARCHCGYRGEEEPRGFVLEDRKIEVAEIMDRWLDPNYRYFKVLGDDEGIYILRHDADLDLWELKIYLRGRKG